MSPETGPGGTGCRDGHHEHPSPAEHPQLGLVPSRTSSWFGAVVLLVVIGLLWWLLPGARIWVLAVLGSWWILTGAVQLALGHRGRCALRRTQRWFFGPAGALLDPFDGD
jgi:hypothetical protein